jgi:monomeric sarcosine oxidase
MPGMNHHDVIVIGCGAVGSGALHQLAKRGLKVLGLDRFGPPHNRGSSHGRTRMIRQAYFEHPDYVPLVLRAYELWGELERAVGRTLYRETGLLEFGPPDGVVVPGVLASAKQHGLAVDELSPADVRRRFPEFVVPGGMTGVFERRAGFLHVEDAIRAQLEEAARLGAVLHVDRPATAWRSEGTGVVVAADGGPYHADRLIITAGAWAGQLLARLNLNLVVRRKPQYWFAPRTADAMQVDRGTPSFLYETADGVFYGFPVCGPEGLKCAEHSGGAKVDDPTQLAEAIDVADLTRVERFVEACLPTITTTLVDHAPCMYTMSPDEQFIVDLYPERPQVAFVAGLSGHGFKFAPVLGEALADLVTTGRTSLPIEFLGLRRFGG